MMTLYDAELLRLTNLNVWFSGQGGTVHAVRGVSLTVGKGETLGIVGESGCGKTATMLAVMRLLPSPPARIQADFMAFDGRDLATLSAAQMRALRGDRLAMVFQEPMTALNPFLTVGEQLKEVIRAHRSVTRGEAHAHVLESLIQVGISDASRRLGQYPHELSGGMRQRVMIAMALLLHPSLLIADEPTTALDATVEAQILEQVSDLRQKMGMSVLWITHNLGIVAEMCNRTVVMYAGSVVEMAPTRVLFTHPRHPYTEALLASLPTFHRPRDPLKGLEGSPPDLSKQQKGCPFAPRCSRAMSECFREVTMLQEVEPGHGSACLRVQRGDF